MFNCAEPTVPSILTKSLVFRVCGMLVTTRTAGIPPTIATRFPVAVVSPVTGEPLP